MCADFVSDLFREEAMFLRRAGIYEQRYKRAEPAAFGGVVQSTQQMFALTFSPFH